ncbi:MAG: 30S ribosomal protein S12 methylthiotransferase RimO [Kiritimatiellia bacterium]|jgi:ribosomal protein S12 methylthiotransferase
MALPQTPPSVGFISLGCAKNLVDSQVMAGAVMDAGMTLASVDDADVLLVNTCAFIQDAVDEATRHIAWACERKAAGDCRAVVVAGCLPQRRRRGLRTAFPGVDAFLGVDELDQVAEIIRKALSTRKPLVRVSPEARRIFNPSRPALRFTGPHCAYLKIAEGCLHACAYCAIPGIRGRQRSRSLPDLVDEAGALLSTGVRELTLVAQDTTAYGRDRRGAPRLPDLLRALDALEGDFWIRLLYGYPGTVDDALLEAMAASRHVVPYLDLPMQHSHPDILRGMRRADTIRPLAGLPARLRAALPGIALRTTCMVGFPGETEAHFQHLLDYVAEARFDALGAFVFRPEKGTPAYGLPIPPAGLSEERHDRLLALQARIMRENHRALAGRTDRALLLRAPARSGGTWLARTPRQAPEVDGWLRLRGVPRSARPGDILPVRYTGGRGCDLLADAIPPRQKRRAAIPRR